MLGEGRRKAMSSGPVSLSSSIAWTAEMVQLANVIVNLFTMGAVSLLQEIRSRAVVVPRKPKAAGV